MVKDWGDPVDAATAATVLTMPEAADPDKPENDHWTRTRTRSEARSDQQERRAETLSPGRGQRLPGWLDKNEADLLLASLEKFEMSGKGFVVFRIPKLLFGAIRIERIRDA